MNHIRRFSSRRQRLDHAFLSARLKEAKSYKRIAGYVRSSIFELVGKEIAAIPKVQIVCNGKLCVSYLTIDDAMFGLSGFRSSVRVFGIMMRSISSIGIAPSKT